MTDDEIQKAADDFLKLDTPKARISFLAALGLENAQRLTKKLADIGHEPAVTSLKHNPLD